VPGAVGAVNVTVFPAGAWTSNWFRPSPVTVWSAESVFVTATVAPGETVVGPVKTKFVIVMVADAAGAAGAEEDGGAVLPGELALPEELLLEQAPAPANRAAASPDAKAIRAVYLMPLTRKLQGSGSIPPKRRLFATPRPTSPPSAAPSGPIRCRTVIGNAIISV
jgi:hypothetical protein